MDTFICSVCGAPHEALPPSRWEGTEEERKRLQAAYHEWDDKLRDAPTNEHYQRSAQKAWTAYAATLSNGVPQFPSTVTTKSGSNGFVILCTSHVSPKG